MWKGQVITEPNTFIEVVEMQGEMVHVWGGREKGDRKANTRPSCCRCVHLNDGFLLDCRRGHRTPSSCSIVCSADGDGHLVEYHVSWPEGVLDWTKCIHIR